MWLNDKATKEDTMERFIQRFSDKITGVLSGFDRLVFRGSFRLLSSVNGMAYFLNQQGIKLTQFKEYVEQQTSFLRSKIQEKVKASGRSVIHLHSPKVNKEEIAREIFQKSKCSKDGLIAVLSCVELSKSFDIHRDKQRKRIELMKAIRPCLHYYFYMIHPEFGFMNARIQTWFPFDIQICINGRESLSRKLDQEKIKYRRRDNCFSWLADPIAAQKLMDQQLKINWVQVFNRLTRHLNPLQSKLHAHRPLDYYWTAHQSEWATDLMFKSSAHLAEIYPALTRFAMCNFSSPDVLRFLGKRIRNPFNGEIISSFKDRPEGVRIKHFLGLNSVKFYDKAGSVLRAETTINEPKALRVYRAKENDRKGERSWHRMRKGIADLYRRAQYSQETNNRYLDALAAVDLKTPLSDLIGNLAKPTTWNGKRVRALNPWAGEDLQLLKAIMRGEFKIAGFRNSQLQHVLFDTLASTEKEKKQRSAKVSRLIRMLRAHHLIRKIPSTYRYILSERGTRVLNTLFKIHDLTLDKLPAA
jgi:hypothetical protein